MGLWAAVGASGALLRPIARSPVGLAALAVGWAFLFGWAMNAWFLAAFGPELSVEAFLLVSARSLPFEVVGAVGNALIALALGPALTRMLDRYGARVRIEYGPLIAGPSPP
jgi:energy-coupling factor transport system substrate-specific component